MSIIKSTIKPGLMVKVAIGATEAVTETCEKLGVKSLTGKCLTGVDPCCGCVIVEFKKKLGTESVFYTSGKRGYCDEVNPEYMTLATAKSAKAEPKATEPVIGKGTYIKVTRDFDAAKVGMYGQIVTSRMGSGSWGIKFPKLTSLKGGHSLSGELKGLDSGKGQWVPADYFKVVSASEYEASFEDAKPTSAEYLDRLPLGITKVRFSLKEATKSTHDRLINRDSNYYGWVTTVEDGLGRRRQVLNAPFGGTEWLSIDAKSDKVGDYRDYSY